MKEQVSWLISVLEIATRPLAKQQMQIHLAMYKSYITDHFWELVLLFHVKSWKRFRSQMQLARPKKLYCKNCKLYLYLQFTIVKTFPKSNVTRTTSEYYEL